MEEDLKGNHPLVRDRSEGFGGFAGGLWKFAVAIAARLAESPKGELGDPRMKQGHVRPNSRAP